MTCKHENDQGQNDPPRPTLAAKDAVSGDADAHMRALLALEAGRMGSWIWDVKEGTVTGDLFLSQFFAVDFTTQPWPVDAMFATIHPCDLPRVRANVAKAMLGENTFEAEFRNQFTDAKTGMVEWRWLGGRGRITKRDEDGTPTQMIGVNWDATQQKTHEERLSILAAEMDHRVKNAFAVIRALINIGDRAPGDKKSLAQMLRSQIDAMAVAHTLSSKMARLSEDPHAEVRVVEIIEAALNPWQSGVRDNLITLSCAPDILLSPQKVSSFSMLCYELATNAAKHGPLGKHSGRLDVSVSCNDDDTITFDWLETLDQPVKRSAVSKGFGATLIGHCTEAMRAKVEKSLSPEGFRISLTFASEKR